jgi:predicted lipoprotein
MKKTSITIDASLLADAEEAAARLGTIFPVLVEEALLRLLKPETQRRPRTSAEPSSGAYWRSLENWRNPFPPAPLLSI